MIASPLVPIENLHNWLTSQGLVVERGQWGPGQAYPILFVRPVGQRTPPDILIPPECKCGHSLAVHDSRGGCLAYGCSCEVYKP